MRGIIHFVSVLIFMCIVSCNDKDGMPLFSPLAYHISYMDYPNMRISPDDTGLVSLEYEKSRIIKRLGGTTVFPVPSGYDFFFAHYVYDELEYRSGQIVISKKEQRGDSSVLINKSVLTFSNGRLIARVCEDPFFGNSTITYEYNNGLLKRKSMANQSGVLKFLIIFLTNHKI
jgi:hypothetical protein